MTWYWWQLVQTFIWGWLGPLSEISAVKGRKLFCKANVLPFLSGIEKRKCKNEKLLHERVENPQREIEFLYQKLLRAYTHRIDITESASAQFPTWIFNFGPYGHLRAVREKFQL